MPISRFAIFPLLVFFMSACSFSPQQSAAPAATNPSLTLPTAISPATQSAAAMETAIATSPPAASDWFGVPVMPGAITGDGDEEGYVFLIRANVDQVKAFYETELPKLGWEPLPGEDELTLLYVKTDGSLSLTINLIARDDMVMVLLAR